MDFGWSLILGAIALLATLVAVLRATRFRGVLVGVLSSLAIVLLVYGAYLELSKPKPWSDVAMRCFPDLRVSPSKTAFGVGLPSYQIYISELGQTVVRAGQNPAHDPGDGAMLQLSSQEFLRCTLTNEGANALGNVAVSFYSDFLDMHGVPTPSSAPSVFAKSDFISGEGGQFEFALIDFGNHILILRGAKITTTTFSTNLNNLQMEVPTKNALRYIMLDPQQRKKTAWIIPTGPYCPQGTEILATTPQQAEQALEALQRLSKSLTRHSGQCKPH